MPAPHATKDTSVVPSTPSHPPGISVLTPPETPGAPGSSSRKREPIKISPEFAQRLFKMFQDQGLSVQGPTASEASLATPSSKLLSPLALGVVPTPPPTPSSKAAASKTAGRITKVKKEKEEDIISIDSDPDSREGAKQDKSFRPGASVSRVAARALKDGPGTRVTRSTARRGGGIATPAPDDALVTKPKPQPRRKKAPKSAPIVISSESDDCEGETAEDRPREQAPPLDKLAGGYTSLAQGAEAPADHDIPALSDNDDSDPPELSDAIRSWFHNTSNGVDHDHELEGGASPRASDQGEDIMDEVSDVGSENDYDREDSFIDDGPLLGNEGDVSHMASNPVEEDAYLSDEETQLEMAKVQSLISQLRGHLTEEDYTRTMDAVSRSLRLANKASASSAVKRTRKSHEHSGKGKKKARYVTPVDHEERGLSDQEEDQLLSALAISRGNVGGMVDASAGTSSSASSQTTMVPTGILSNAPAPTPIAAGPVVPTSALVTNATSSSTAGFFSAPGASSAILAASAASVGTAGPGGVSFADLLAQVPNASAYTNSTYANAVFVQHATVLPATNDVHKAELQDPLLLLDYAGLCNLRFNLFFRSFVMMCADTERSAGAIQSWSKQAGPGHPWFCQWGVACPSMNGLFVQDVVRFVESPTFKYINPSRASPLVVHLRETNNRPPRYQLMRDRKVVYAVSCGKVEKCHLVTPYKYAMQQKFINISLHKQEWERWMGWICMVFGQSSLDAQYASSALQLATRSDLSQDKKEAHSPRESLTDEFVLDTNDDVPIYDARAIPQGFNFTNDIENIGSRLPRWSGGEIPEGSCVAAAYSVVMYMSGKKRWTLACNVRWVVVLGVTGNAN
ncbi:hypothetical protein MD484_g6812, partial [Candolleomyces efflorescens]